MPAWSCCPRQLNGGTHLGRWRRCCGGGMASWIHVERRIHHIPGAPGVRARAARQATRDVRHSRQVGPNHPACCSRLVLLTPLPRGGWLVAGAHLNPDLTITAAVRNGTTWLYLPAPPALGIDAAVAANRCRHHARPCRGDAYATKRGQELDGDPTMCPQRRHHRLDFLPWCCLHHGPGGVDAQRSTIRCARQADRRRRRARSSADRQHHRLDAAQHDDREHGAPRWCSSTTS